MITPIDSTRYLSFGQFIQKLLEDHELKQHHVARKTGSKVIDSGTFSRICSDHVPKQRKTRMDAALKAASNLVTYLQQAGIPQDALGNLGLFKLWYALVEHPFKFLGLTFPEETLDSDVAKVVAALNKYPQGSVQRATLAETLVSVAESLDPVLTA